MADLGPGAGAVDPVAALTWDLPDNAQPGTPVRDVAAPPEPPLPDTTPRTVAFTGAAVLALAVAVGAGIAARRRKEPTP